MGEEPKPSDAALQSLPSHQGTSDLPAKGEVGGGLNGCAAASMNGGGETRLGRLGQGDMEERRKRERRVREMLTPAELRMFDRVMLRLDADELGSVDDFVQAASSRRTGGSSSSSGDGKGSSQPRAVNGSVSTSAWLTRAVVVTGPREVVEAAEDVEVVEEMKAEPVLEEERKKKKRGLLSGVVGCVKQAVGAGVRAVGNYFEETASDEALDEAEGGNPRRWRLAMEAALAERKAKGLPPPPDLPHLRPQKPGWLWRAALGLTTTAAIAVLGKKGGVRFCVKSPFPDVRERDRVPRRLWPPRPKRKVILLGNGEAARIMGYESVAECTAESASLASDVTSEHDKPSRALPGGGEDNSPGGWETEAEVAEMSEEAHQFVERILADAFADRDSEEEDEVEGGDDTSHAGGTSTPSIVQATVKEEDVSALGGGKSAPLPVERRKD